MRTLCCVERVLLYEGVRFCGVSGPRYFLRNFKERWTAQAGPTYDSPIYAEGRFLNQDPLPVNSAKYSFSSNTTYSFQSLKTEVSVVSKLLTKVIYRVQSHLVT